MLVCHCNVVNDRRIRAEIERGARDEVDVAMACGAGTDCGGCLPAVQRLLDECLGCPALHAHAAAGGSASLSAHAAAGGSASLIDLTVEVAVG